MEGLPLEISASTHPRLDRLPFHAARRRAAHRRRRRAAVRGGRVAAGRGALGTAGGRAEARGTQSEGAMVLLGRKEVKQWRPVLWTARRDGAR